MPSASTSQRGFPVAKAASVVRLTSLGFLTRASAIIGAALLLTSCTILQEQPFTLNDLKPGEGKVMKERNDQWPWSGSHTMTAWRDPAAEGGRTHLVVENASDAGMNALENAAQDPLSTAMRHFVWMP